MDMGERRTHIAEQRLAGALHHFIASSRRGLLLGDLVERVRGGVRHDARRAAAPNDLDRESIRHAPRREHAPGVVA